MPILLVGPSSNVAIAATTDEKPQDGKWTWYHGGRKMVMIEWVHNQCHLQDASKSAAYAVDQAEGIEYVSGFDGMETMGWH
jgi:hypothetical protein